MFCACRACLACVVLCLGLGSKLTGGRALLCWFSVLWLACWRADQRAFSCCCIACCLYVLVQRVMAFVLACWSVCLLPPCCACFGVLVGLMRVAAFTHAELCLWFGTAGLTGCVYNLRCRSVSLSTLKLAVLACFAFQVLACWFSVPGYWFTQLCRANVACLAPMVTQFWRAF